FLIISSLSELLIFSFWFLLVVWWLCCSLHLPLTFVHTYVYPRWLKHPLGPFFISASAEATHRTLVGENIISFL
ncbi:MAG TPA: hypothetical protein VK766_08435, partial [Cytophagaceae bacterium]|nr:hypothetical protein [Cytophagaceae bacterium]